MRSGRSWPRLAIFAALACGIAVVAGVHGWAGRYFLDEAARQGRAAIELHREVVRGWLGRYRALAPVYARDPSVVGLLNYPDDGLQLDLVNRKLAAWTKMSGASDTYLLDTNGTAIAASNWADEVSFVGKDWGGSSHLGPRRKNGVITSRIQFVNATGPPVSQWSRSVSRGSSRTCAPAVMGSSSPMAQGSSCWPGIPDGG
jgi:hypothetical protein